MAALRKRLERIAGSSRPALVIGATGAGKEGAVRALHAWSDRAQEPFLGVDCGAIPETLMEDELFGHERGAFTNADRRRAGWLEEVGGGTLFFDEIAELPLLLQAKLLRVLELGVFRPLGGGAERAFRGRIVAATNANLAARVADGTFRADLYYRLHVLTARVPSLAERREDIPLLVQHFLAQQGRPLWMTQAALDAMADFAWPGNVRQLRSVVDRMATFSDDDVLDARCAVRELAAEDDAQPEPEAQEERPTPLRDLARRALAMPGGNKLEAMERALVDEALRLTDGNKSEAARRLGVHRKVVERRVDAALSHGSGAPEHERILCQTLRNR